MYPENILVGTPNPSYQLSIFFLDLMKIIQDRAPKAIRQQELKSYFGRKIAIDASMCLYQFLVAVRSDGQNLSNDGGEVTSHLSGMFYRTLRLLDNGLKPIYVFDGKPPEMKGGELEKRKVRRDEAEAQLKTAEEEGDKELIDKWQRRTVKATSQQNEEVKRLLRLMGVPYVEAPCEAEAMCAKLCKDGLVYATSTEDMDALTFGTPRLVRNLTMAESRNLPIFEIDLEKVLEELDLDMNQFIDLCILLGCDYTGTIPRVGPHTAFELIQKYKSIEAALESIDRTKHPVNLDEFRYKESALLFTNPDVGETEGLTFEWKLPDKDGLIEFLCGEKGFSEERVSSGVLRLINAREKNTQQRLDSFIKIIPRSASVVNPAQKAADARKAAEAASKKRRGAASSASTAKKPRR